MGEAIVDGVIVVDGMEVIGAVVAELPEVTVAEEAAVDDTSVTVVFGVVVAETDVAILDRLEAEAEEAEIEVSVTLADPLVTEVAEEVDKVIIPVPELDVVVADPV